VLESQYIMNDDIHHLRLLTIGHYIDAAITALFACFPLIHVSIGLFFLLNPPQVQNGEPFPAQAFGLMFLLIGGAFVLCGWAFAVCIFMAGRSLAARKRYLFCIISIGDNSWCLVNPGLSAAYGQGNVQPARNSRCSTSGRSGTRGLA
jgi:hypothetical protein